MDEGVPVTNISWNQTKEGMRTENLSTSVTYVIGCFERLNLFEDCKIISKLALRKSQLVTLLPTNEPLPNVHTPENALMFIASCTLLTRAIDRS